MKLGFFLLLSSFVTLFFLVGCSGDGVDLIVDKPEMLKKEKIATFYGASAKETCETYRKLYAGFCDTKSQPFITCFDINDKKYKQSSCE